MGTTGRLKEELKCEILGIAFVALGVLGIVCLLSPSSGLISQFVDRVLKGIAGEGRYLFPLLLVLTGVRLVLKRSKTRISERMYGAGLLYLVALTFFHLMIPPEDSFKAGVAGDGGGVMGALLSYGFRKSFGITGTYIILITAGVISLLLLTNLSLVAIARSLTERCKTVFKKGLRSMEGFLFVDVEEEEEREKEKEKIKKSTAKNRLLSIPVNISPFWNQWKEQQRNLRRKRNLKNPRLFQKRALTLPQSALSKLIPARTKAGTTKYLLLTVNRQRACPHISCPL